jgi:hypothetical protein
MWLWGKYKTIYCLFLLFQYYLIMQEAAPYIVRHADWITYIFLGLFLTISMTRLLFHERIIHTFGLLVYKRFLNSYYNPEANVILNTYQSIMFMMQLVILSLLLYFVNTTFQLTPSMRGFMGFLEIMGVLVLYFLLRFHLGFIVAIIFDFKQLHIRLIYEKTNYLSWAVLWVLPFLILYVYALDFNETFLTGILLFFCLLLIMRYLLLISNNKKLLFGGLFYFILYLCALEIAPLIIILKLSI